MYRRLTLVVRGLFARRQHPDLEALAAETDPERFVWAVLPHAARSFAASIVVLRPAEARVAAVAYLYARMLDTYEDLLPDEEQRPAALRAFAARFERTPPDLPSPIRDDLATDDRDRLHLLLVQRAGLVDAVFAGLEERHRRAVAELIAAMAEGMAWSSERFVEQGGVLVDDDQLRRYCHAVIGFPAIFVIELLTGRPPASRADALAAGELIQLANVTRDIEKDLARGIAYDAVLRPHLGMPSAPEVPAVRRRLVSLALSRASAYRSLYESVDLSGRRGARLAAVLMLSFTDLHFRRMTSSVGRSPWRGPPGKTTMMLRALPAIVSGNYASALIARLERSFLDASAAG
jgi:phytoene/squalene synthetase